MAMKILQNKKFQSAGITLEQAAARIRLVACDIDGVLTDGRIGAGMPDGEEVKFFDVRDGSGMVMLRRAGIKVGCISGRKSRANESRAAELNLDFLEQKCYKKLAKLEELAQSFGYTLEECLFVGDDLIDAAAIANCGIGVAVGDAEEELLRVADLQCSRPGGRGAVREVANWLLQLQGHWDKELEHYGIPK